MASDIRYKTELIPLLNRANVLSFGTYTLKSGRQSPYFFTSTLLHKASLLGALGRACAAVLSAPPFSRAVVAKAGVVDANTTDKFEPDFDVVFGPAYKGIPLSAIVVRELDFAGPNYHDVAYSFNRKEAKDHGEGGSIVGAPLKGQRIVIVDDVLTAGTALREAVAIIKAQGGIVVGVLLLLNRQERVSDEEPRSAMKVAADELKVPVHAVLNFEDLIEAIDEGKVEGAGPEQVLQMRNYRDQYGCKD